eukprot:2465837-Lingulodinium_polyedra.AAC.1
MDAILRLLSQPARKAFAAIVAVVETSTLDVERKRDLDRRSAVARVGLAATASRGAFVRRWRRESRVAAP